MVKPNTARKQGRPRKDNERPIVSIRLDKSIIEKLDELSERKKRSRTSQIEYIVTKYLEEHTND